MFILINSHVDLHVPGVSPSHAMSHAEATLCTSTSSRYNNLDSPTVYFDLISVYFDLISDVPILILLFLKRISQRHSLSGDLLTVNMIIDLYTSEATCAGKYNMLFIMSAKLCPKF